MSYRMVGCTHHQASLELRQQLAFDSQQTLEALAAWRHKLRDTELVLLSTCNRVELYAATYGDAELPSSEALSQCLLSRRNIPSEKLAGHWQTLDEVEVVRHLFRVAASLDSMVVGEPQILAQVKHGYQHAQQAGSTGPLLHDLFQSALRTAKRVAAETGLYRHRVSIPSVAIADLASCVFESFNGKHVLVAGAGEMADETLRYLQSVGRPGIHVVNRNAERGVQLAQKWGGAYHSWDQLADQLVHADLAISTTSATEPIVTEHLFREQVAPRRHQRPLFILDLSVPCDFEAAVGAFLGVYLYTLDDLDQACAKNRAARAKELPAAEEIVADETERFVIEEHHRATAPVITGLREGFHRPKEAELARLFQKLPELDENARQEIECFADRLVNKMLHPPLESLRDASQNGTPHYLLDALRRLFRLED